MGYLQSVPRTWTQNYRERNPASDRAAALNPGPPDYNTSALFHHAPSRATFVHAKPESIMLFLSWWCLLNQPCLVSHLSSCDATLILRVVFLNKDIMCIWKQYFTGAPHDEMDHCSSERSIGSLWLNMQFFFSQILALFALTFWKIHERWSVSMCSAQNALKRL